MRAVQLLRAGKILAGATLTAVAGYHPSDARTLEVGPGLAYESLSKAAGDARDGDRVTIAAGVYHECAVWRANHLTIEGAATSPGVLITGEACLGKGLFVVMGNDVTVKNITFEGARVSDLNGAGIRGEGSDLTVDSDRFIANQNGILASGVAASKLLVRDSYFERNGTCEGACAHGIYVGQVGLLRIEHSVFFETFEGHHIKSRALRTEIVNCKIADGDQGTASYLIDVPNGGDVLIRDAELQKGPNAQGHVAAVRIGEEGATNQTREILVQNNQFQNAGAFLTTFVRNDSGADAILSANRLTGSVVPLQGRGQVQ
jgi:Right handed beta helix region